MSEHLGFYTYGPLYTSVFDADSGTYINQPSGYGWTTLPDSNGAQILPWAYRDTYIQNTGTYQRIKQGDFVYEQNSTPVSNVDFTASQFTKILTTKEVNGFEIVVSFPNLYMMDATQPTGMNTASVTYSIVYRPKGSTGSWNVIVRSEVVSAAVRTEVTRSYQTNASLPLDYYEIAVVRETPDHDGSNTYVDTMYIKSLTEYVDGALIYPYTALLGIKVRATDQLSGQLPTITSLVKGIKVLVPSNLQTLPKYNSDGTPNQSYYSQYSQPMGSMTTTVWSDNPVWCLYDLLTNNRYGLSDYYKIDPNKKGLMLANFYIMAKYCDELVQYIDEFGVTNYRSRFTLNLVIDQSKPASEWIATICSTMRAVAYYTEGIFWLDIDRPKYITQIFNMSNIKEFAQSGTSYKAIPNVYETQFPNPDNNYVIDSFRIDSPDYINDPTLEERKKSLTFLGVTDFEHAKALTKYTLLTGSKLNKLVSFKTGTDGLRCAVTDVIGIQHDVPQWGWGGKVEGYSIYGNSFSLNLSSEFTYDPSFGALNMLISRAGVQNPFYVTVSPPPAGVCSQLTVANTAKSSDGSVLTSYTPQVGDSYIIQMATQSISTFKVLNIKRDADEYCTISAILYDDSIFTAADSTADLGNITLPKSSDLINPSRVSVTGLNVTDNIYQNTNGNWVTGVTISYNIPVSSFWKGAIVNWGLAGTGQYEQLPINTTGQVSIPSVNQSGSYQFVVTSVYTNGTQTIPDALADWENHPYVTKDISLYAPNTLFMAGVTGLAIRNMANDGTFYGKDCTINWRPPAVIDAAAQTTAAGTAGGTSSGTWFKDYKVDVYNVTGSLRSTNRIFTESFTYTLEMNHLDGNGIPARTFNITVTAYDRLGRESAPKTILCSNPAPVAIS